MSRVFHNSIWYVDKIGYECMYTLGGRDLNVVWTGEVYHCFNGMMLLAVI